MPLLPLLILAVVQGLTEFLPVSSSGHLVIVWGLFDEAGTAWSALGEGERALIDIAVHAGSLGAVLLYFWRDMLMLAGGGLKLLTGRPGQAGRLLLLVILATLPLVVAGFLFKDLVFLALRNLWVTAAATLGFGILLGIADGRGMTLRRTEHLRPLDAIVVGLFQVLALIPGTSRSGITMTAARFLGLERAEAARFSLWLSVPAILGAATLALADLTAIDDPRLTRAAVLAGLFAFAAALVSIAAMMAWLKHAGFLPFVVYRVLLGLGLFAALLLGWLGPALA